MTPKVNNDIIINMVKKKNSNFTTSNKEVKNPPKQAGVLLSWSKICRSVNTIYNKVQTTQEVGGQIRFSQRTFQRGCTALE